MLPIFFPRKIPCTSHTQNVISVVPSRTIDVRYLCLGIRQDAWEGDGEVPKKKRKSSFSIRRKQRGCWVFLLDKTPIVVLVWNILTNILNIRGTLIVP